MDKLKEILSVLKENIITVLGYLIVVPIMCGFLIVNMDLSKYGLMDFSLLKAKALYSGLFFIFFVAFFVTGCFFIFNKLELYVKKEKDKSISDPMLIFTAPFWLLVFYFDFFSLFSFVTHNTNLTSERVFESVFLFVCLFSLGSILSYFLSNNEIYFIFDKANTKSKKGLRIVVHIFLFLPVFLSRTKDFNFVFFCPMGTTVLKLFLSSYFITFLIFCGCNLVEVYFKKKIATILSTFDRKKAFLVTFILLIVFVFLSLYSNFIYTSMPENIGGGYKRTVELCTNDGVFLGTEIYKNEQAIYLQQEDDIMYIKLEEVKTYREIKDEFPLFGKKFNEKNLVDRLKFENWKIFRKNNVKQVGNGQESNGEN